MFRTAGPLRLAGSLASLMLVLTLSATAGAQSTNSGFMTGEAAQAFEKWQAAMQAILERDDDGAEAAFGELLAMEPSPMRIALLATHTVKRTSAAGALMLFEQDRDVDALGANGEQVAELLEIGTERRNQAHDVYYYASLGRFDVAGANLRALLAADPDPVAVLDYTDRDPLNRRILVRLIANEEIGAEVRQLLTLLNEGESAIKADPTRIKENITRLGGPPRGFENAVDALKDSGEYSIPFLIECLRDTGKAELHQAILRCLPRIDRPALNPLVQSLRMNDDPTKQHVLETIGKIGYVQAVPYLLQLSEASDTSSQIRSSVSEALDALRRRGASFEGLSAAQAFFALAEDYYNDKDSLAADPRLPKANVWYWRDDLLQNVMVPTVIFNEIMCMRCCEEALQLDPDMKPALALWLAANFRREAQLPVADKDYTRPDKYPSAAYFAQSAGAEYCLMALARAVDDNDPAVALGSIDALRKTAGPASLISDSAGRLPLAEALSFSDRMVRIRAALTLAHANPSETFQNYQNLMPVLSEALTLHAGAKAALVVDPDDASANTVADVLRRKGYEVLTDSSLFSGLQKVRDQVAGVDVIFVASDLPDPGVTGALEALRGEFRFAAVPVVIITKPGDSERIEELARGDYRLGDVPMDPSGTQVSRAIATVSRAVGAQTITKSVGGDLATDAVAALRLLGVTRNTIFDVAGAETALLDSLETKNETLRLAVAEVLGFIGSSQAQEAISKIALDSAEPEAMRVSMFAALAEAAKRRGSQLGQEAIAAIVEIAEGDENLTIREAASQTLGALNVAGGPASRIIRNQYRG